MKVIARKNKNFVKNSDRHQESSSLELVFYLVLVALITLGLAIVDLTFPLLGKTLVSEDHLVENLTAIAAFVAFGIALGRYFQLRQSASKRMALALVAIALIVGLDEISFGHRLIGFQLPATAAGFQVDGVHDGIVLTKSWMSQGLAVLRQSLSPAHYDGLVAALKGAIACLFLGASIKLLWGRYSPLVRLLQRVRQQPLYEILFAAAALVAIAQIADIFELQQSFLVFLEEVLELNAALGLAIAAGCLQRYDRRQQRLGQILSEA